MLSSEVASIARPKRAAARRRRTQAERSAGTRRKLLAAAIDLICEKGFFDLTLGKVADRAGVSRGAVQHHFGMRGELLLALMNDFSPAYLKPVAPSDGGSLTARVDAVIDHFWTLYQHKQALAVFHIWLGARADPELQPMLGKTMRRFEQELDRQWRDIFADRHLPPARIAAARRVALAGLRGFAIYLKDRRHWRAELSLLKEMLVAILSHSAP
jgi:AcrR family transcriptional regulator